MTYETFPMKREADGRTAAYKHKHQYAIIHVEITNCKIGDVEMGLDNQAPNSD